MKKFYKSLAIFLIINLLFTGCQENYVTNDFDEKILDNYKISLQRHNHKSQQKPSQPTLKRRCFFVKSDAFLWPGFGKEWC